MKLRIAGERHFAAKTYKKQSIKSISKFLTHRNGQWCWTLVVSIPIFCWRWRDAHFKIVEKHSISCKLVGINVNHNCFQNTSRLKTRKMISRSAEFLLGFVLY